MASLPTSVKPSSLHLPAAPLPGRGSNQRSRTGCVTCRSRKVKCDETRPNCLRCSAGNRECEWPSSEEQTRKKRKFAVPTLSQYAQPAASTASPAGSKHSPGTNDWFGNNELVPSPARLQMLQNPVFLHPYFTSLDQVQCFRTYISQCDHLHAFTCIKTPFNPWITHHAPLVFNHTPGASTTADALKVGVVAIGAVLLHYQTDPSPKGLVRAHEITKRARYKVLQLLKPVMEVQGGDELAQGDLEMTLAALLSCTVAGTLAADDGWNDLLRKISTFIDRLGGIPALLDRCPNDDYSVIRFALEQLAVRDVIACMTTGRKPTILKDTQGSMWFMEIDKRSRRGIEWESCERMFGLSRNMVMIMARVCHHVAVVREKAQYISESLDFSSLFTYTSPTDLPSASASTSNLPTLTIEDLLANPYLFDTDPNTTSSTQELSQLKETADGLMAELGVWEYGANWIPFHPRTQYGNHCYRHAMRIALLRDVYGVEDDDERVVASALAIVELGKELMVNFGHINWLSWPVLLAGFHVGVDKGAREDTVNLLRNAGPHSCFDVHTGISLLEQFWKRYDEDASGVRHWEVGEQLHQRLFAG